MRWLLAILLALLVSPVLHASSQYVIHTIYVFNLQGSITSATAQELGSILERASSTPSSAVLLILTTPGGELDASLNIVSLFENSRIPIIGYVYPTGSYAWSAGTLVLLSTTIAAMAPGTVIGSCQPVELNPVTGQTIPVNDSKVLNAVSKYFVEVAAYRGRNSTFAEQCVRNNVNLGPKEALNYHVIDFIAENPYSLLSQINGSTIGGTTYVVINPELIEVNPGLNYALYQFLTDPIIESLLSGLGFILLLVGLLSGHYYVAAVGFILILLPVLTGLPVNVFGLVLLILGVVLLLIDVLTGVTTHGSLLVSGIVLSAIGLILLQPTYPPSEWLLSANQVMSRVVLYTLIGFNVAFALFVLSRIVSIIRARPISKNLFEPRGKVGIAVEEIRKGGVGYVKVQGEYWKARATEDIPKGSRVIVIGIEDDLLIVSKA